MSTNDKEMRYLSQLDDIERKKDTEELKEFLGIVYSWDPMDRDMDLSLEFNFFEANDFNYSVNKILHKYLGFDERIANDSFFRRFQTITKKEFYNYKLKKKDFYFRFEFNLWEGFSIDRLVPEMFKELEGLIDIKKIRQIYINVESITGAISENLFAYTPNVEFIRFYIYGSIEIPERLFDNTPSLQEVDLYNVSKIPPKIFQNTTQLTNVSISGNCQIAPIIFKYTPLLQVISLEGVHGISENLLQGLSMRVVDYYKCKFNSSPSFLGISGISSIKHLRIIDCDFPKTQEDNLTHLDTPNYELINNDCLSELSSLKILQNSPSLKIYNNIYSLLSSSQVNCELKLDLENDIDIVHQDPLPTINKLTIQLKNNLTTMDSVKKFLRLFPGLTYFQLNGEALNGGLITYKNFNSDDLKRICPKLDEINIHLF